MNIIYSVDFQKMRTKEKTEKFFKIIYLSIYIVTLTWTLSLIIFHFYTNSVFGFNPTYNSPANVEFMENNLIIEMGRFLIIFWIVAMWCSLYIFPIIFLINLFLKFILKINPNWRIILCSFSCCLSMWLILYVPNFGNTFNWMLD